MNVHKQTGVVDRALYAMAVAMSLASKSDPTFIIFEQADLRSHYCQCMETGKVTDFPVRKKRRPDCRILCTEECFVYCYCRMPDNGELMICCSQCSDWFHEICITEHIPKDIEQWIYVCKTCQQNSLFMYV